MIETALKMTDKKYVVYLDFCLIDILPKLAEVLNCSIEELVYAIIETKNRVKEKDLQNKL